MHALLQSPSPSTTESPQTCSFPDLPVLIFPRSSLTSPLPPQKATKLAQLHVSGDGNRQLMLVSGEHRGICFDHQGTRPSLFLSGSLQWVGQVYPSLLPFYWQDGTCVIARLQLQEALHVAEAIRDAEAARKLPGRISLQLVPCQFSARMLAHRVQAKQQP